MLFFTCSVIYTLYAVPWDAKDHASLFCLVLVSLFKSVAFLFLFHLAYQDIFLYIYLCLFFPPWIFWWLTDFIIFVFAQKHANCLYFMASVDFNATFSVTSSFIFLTILVVYDPSLSRKITPISLPISVFNLLI